MGTISDRRDIQPAKALSDIIISEVGKVRSVKAQFSRCKKYIQKCVIYLLI